MNARDATLGAVPLRRQHIQALQRRAATQTGEVRALLEQRLTELMVAESRVMADASAADRRDAAAAAGPPAAGPLRALVEHLTAEAARGAIAQTSSSTGSPALAVLDEIRRTCAKIRNESQLRQALEAAPDDAGPLNSASLVHRALTRMQALSPAYLQHFIAYVDALSALEPREKPPHRSPQMKKAQFPKTRSRGG